MIPVISKFIVPEGVNPCVSIPAKLWFVPLTDDDPREISRKRADGNGGLTYAAGKGGSETVALFIRVAYPDGTFAHYVTHEFTFSSSKDAGTALKLMSATLSINSTNDVKYIKT